VREHFGDFRHCYEQGLARNKDLTGRVGVRFVITREGDVTDVTDEGSDLPDEEVRSCIRGAFSVLKFPQPRGGIVTVVYPIMLEPG